MEREQTVGVVGASARAAVHSLLRAGFKAWAVDLFGDRDLAMVAPCAVCPLGDYPQALPQLAKQFPPGPFIYTGGLENHPQIVAELAATRGLWGNPPDVLERVRDPYQLFPLLADAGFRVPAIVPRFEPCPATGRWLRKPLRSGGGLGIRFAIPGEPASSQHIFQEFIDGIPMSALFMSDPDEPDEFYRACLECVTEQLIGEQWLHATPFAYCGNIGPIELASNLRAAAFIGGLHLMPKLLLRGLWGLDFILRGETIYPVEINPRYTAALEVLEHGSQCSSLTSHGQCFPESRALWKMKGCNRFDTPVGKAIYYAPHDIAFPVSGPWDADLTLPFDPWRLPTFADIPAAGAVIHAGQPVITMFEKTATVEGCRERLQSRALQLDELFGKHRT